MECKHCQRPATKGIRGLCFRCYNDRTIRARYPKLRNVGGGLGLVAPKILPAPTRELPGTEAKIAELRRRVESQAHLWNEADARPCDGDPVDDVSYPAVPLSGARSMATTTTRNLHAAAAAG